MDKLVKRWCRQQPCVLVTTLEECQRCCRTQGDQAAKVVEGQEKVELRADDCLGEVIEVAGEFRKSSGQARWDEERRG